MWLTEQNLHLKSEKNIWVIMVHYIGGQANGQIPS